MATPRCFVIGPMSGGHMEILNWLANEVLKPLLPVGFTVQTPNLNKPGNIMRQVIRCCDRATLVVANMTGNNPNVLYEIAALDAMGRACIPVVIIDQDSTGTASSSPGGTEESRKIEDPRIAFDRAAYRWFAIYRAPDKRAETDRVLRETIANVLATHEAGGTFDNPLTDFYTMSLMTFSSAHGLARGYFLNMVQPAVRAIINGFEKGLTDRAAKTPFPKSACEFARYSDGGLDIVIPRKLDDAERFTVTNLLNKGYFREVSLPARARSITAYEWTEQNDESSFRWLDIPTTIASLRQIVSARLGRDAALAPVAERQELEEEEIDRFRRALWNRIVEDDDAEFRKKIRIVKWPETWTKE